MQSTRTSESSGPIRTTHGNLSCAECRRSKLRCDRIFPCKSCIRRGCADICPTGTMPPVKGDIALKAKAQKLTAEVDMLKSRIGELEAMLATGQQGVPRRSLFAASNTNPASAKERRGMTMIPSNDIRDLLGAFPFGKKDHSYSISMFEPYMPTKRNAFHMSRLYYTRANFKCVSTSSNLLPPANQTYRSRTNIVASDEFYSTILDVIYGGGEAPSLANIHPHKLSIFFATLSLGGLCDEDSIIQELASMYDPVARAALSFCPLTTGACRATVQGILLITRLLHNQEVGVSEECWLLNGINNRLVHQVCSLRLPSPGTVNLHPPSS
ncbi:hypothetical protein CVT24_000146 [Panaeolus cyanescens]|uniref:Zn(2)-C6 fungal-type domain-containing protein n=1 Tax=Panaeolus cyanescens TaxID=181874 RepID=A0A409WBW8_9AGAR|nr:hypothetical protein CVT24_000146 [Panaeolus cyanescens]